jgi:hypothetical protein
VGDFVRQVALTDAFEFETRPTVGTADTDGVCSAVEDRSAVDSTLPSQPVDFADRGASPDAPPPGRQNPNRIRWLPIGRREDYLSCIYDKLGVADREQLESRWGGESIGGQ